MQIKRMGWRVGALTIVIATCLAMGCAPSRDENLPETAPVYGVVTLKGEKLPEGTVRFLPENPLANPASGMILADGSFKLSTYERHDGAALGKHKVTVIVEPRLDGSSPDPPFLIPKRYQSEKTTPLEVEIVKGKRNEVVFDLD
ncbi:hypothetical protein LOC68_22470 [Blastopirellula sp. JC732]|uniref:Carboxypeptidase regulatory-like domain-containing protein n=1 Tax=Blastopirellula sediminis TaxID=2894196 RepID=A0A9X1SIE6_9BACT|nr:hypothetical protein [Blastopirellula sediminis]MCC9605533.1 hypothetical protein [Blastopirellula sediminis]MCC9631167.1 hypothetical protein [Blastopirellula sediminis]